MKKRLLGLLLALFTIVMFLSTVMNVYASGIPVDYTVNIPQVPARYPPSDGTWDVLWSYSAPSGQSVVTISPVIKNVNINNSVVVRIVCDGVTVLVQTLSPFQQVNPTIYGSFRAVSIEQNNGYYSSWGAAGLEPGGILKCRAYAASENTAQNAVDAANAANSNAWNAYNAANTAASRVWDSTENKSAATLAKEARDKANQALTEINNVKNSADAAKSSADLAASRTLYNGQSAAYWAYQAAQAANTPPVITKIQGLNGATCTRGTSFTLIVTASDNGPPSNLRYRVTCDSYDSGWSSSNILTVTGLSVPGAKTATVMVSDNPNAPDSGNIAQIAFTFFKI